MKYFQKYNFSKLDFMSKVIEIIWLIIPRRFHKNAWLRKSLLMNRKYNVFGKYFVSLDNIPAIVVDDFESNISKWFNIDKKGIFIDIGSNVGYYSVLLSDKMNIVYAFEPFNSTYKCLIKNIELNKVNNIIPVNMGLWKKSEILDFSITDSSATNNIADSKYVNKVVDTVKIPFIALDDLGLIKCDIVKIDVEGSEYQVLQGMAKTLRKYHPKIVIEIRDYNYEKVLKFLQKFEYIQYDSDTLGKNYLFEYSDAPDIQDMNIPSIYSETIIEI